MSRATIIGWDIGGVHLKAACLAGDRVTGTLCRTFAIQQDMPRLADTLREMAAELGGQESSHAVTMTGELSQRFRLKRDGVNAILDAAAEAFPPDRVRVFAVDGSFLSIAEARVRPLAVAASNWAATARLVAPDYPDALLIDIGSTTTDIIPIQGGAVAALGATDPERLQSGELVYSGMVRTAIEAIVRTIPWQGAPVAVSAESFALTGDAHLWLGRLAPEDYTTPTPDGRPATRTYAGERLARVICADREQVSEAELELIARTVVQGQLDQITAGIRQVLARHPGINRAVVTGLGEALGAEAARAAGLAVVMLAERLGREASRIAPATAVAMLLQRSGDPHGRLPTVPGNGRPAAARQPQADGGVHLPGRLTVVKVGGALASTPGMLSRVGQSLARAAASRQLVVIPGGGPFAERVRAYDQAHGLSPAAAHWMAILAMDQYAHLLADHLPGGVVVEDLPGVRQAHQQGAIPILAPSRWLKATDDLPHSWDVTSDSLAAYLATLLGAEELILLKPISGGADLVDRFFARALPAGLPWQILGPEDLGGWTEP